MSASSGRYAGRRTGAEALFIAFLSLFAASFFVVAALRPGGEAGLAWFSNLSLTVAALASGLLSLAAATRIASPERRSWGLIGVGISCWGLGQVAWTFYESILGQETPFPSLADVGYLAMIPFIFAGLVTLPAAARSRPVDRLAVGLDAFIVMASSATVSWFVLLGPLYTRVEAPWVEKLIGLAYPAGDLLLLCALIGAIARGSIARRDPVVPPLLLGIVLLITADSAFTYLTLHDAYGSGNPIDLGWPLGFLLIAFAAVRRAIRGPAPGRVRDLGQRGVGMLGRLAPYPPLLGVTALLVFVALREGSIERGIFLGLGLATLLLILIRQFVILLENARLNRALRSFSRRLEALVAERTATLVALHDLAAALCTAASSQEVCRIGLNASLRATDGKAAILYIRHEGKYMPTADESAARTYAPSLAPGIADQLECGTVATQGGGTSGRGTIWIPASERGQAYGCIAVLDAALDKASDAQYLATIGAEFGVAHAAQCRFEAARASEARFRSLVQNSSDIVTVVDSRGIITYHSPAAERVFGENPEALCGAELARLLHPDDSCRAGSVLTEAAAREGSITAEWRWRRGDGWCYVQTVITNMLSDPNVHGLVLNSRDISAHKALESQLTHQAFHDSLTGLANRALFRARVEHALLQASRHGGQVAVLFLDLDDFKTVNDSLGHTAGDELLAALAARLRDCVRAGDTVSRLGGDEFAVLLEGVRDVGEVTEVGERITAAFHVPFSLQGMELFARASIGIALTAAPNESADDLIRNADVAMYVAKGQGKGCQALFEPGMYAAARARLALEADLRHGVECGEFVVHYQPLVELATDRIAGVEALVRWRHPERGLVPPGEFINVAEELGLLSCIDRQVLREACRQVRHWQAHQQGGPPLTASVNLSAKQLQQPRLGEEVARALQDSGLAPECLSLEITEGMLMQDIAVTVDRLRELKALGVQLAIDDFGTGYSSLSYLQQLPVDTLKIDQSFVTQLGAAPGAAKLPSAIIDLGHTLGLMTVAEGIERQDQAELLGSLGCTLGQGYYYARPLAPNDLELVLCRGIVAGRGDNGRSETAA